MPAPWMPPSAPAPGRSCKPKPPRPCRASTAMPAGSTGTSCEPPEAEPRLSQQPRNLDRGAAVHDHREPGLLGAGGGGLVLDAELHPDHLGADGHGLVGNGPRVAGVAEDIHHVDL